MKILLTGGAGYIGSHVAHMLADTTHDFFIIDNFTTGYKSAVDGFPLLEADLADRDVMDALFAREKFDAVIHFAASCAVEESVYNPLKYFRNNTANTLTLLELCKAHHVGNFIFSSTPAIHGTVEDGVPVSEDQAAAPLSPYGASKYFSEQMIEQAARADGLNYIILRYFNAAGADVQGRTGQRTKEATHLIKVACETALGLRKDMALYGTDYDTHDGSCIRDYIHVNDLAQAHLQALEHLENGGENATLNCGYGTGFSVREVIAMVKKLSGHDFTVHEQGRRAGDPASVIADNTKIKEILNWTPEYNSLETIVKTALDWEEKMLHEAAEDTGGRSVIQEVKR